MCAGPRVDGIIKKNEPLWIERLILNNTQSKGILPRFKFILPRTYPTFAFMAS